MKLIQTQTLGSSSSTISFSEIPQTFTDLLVVSSIRASDTGPWASIQFNGSTANFTRRALEGTGSSVSSTSRTDGLNAVVQNPSDSTANTFSNSSIYIPNYTGSTAKSVSIDTVSENNGTSVVQAITAFLWNNTAAITSMTITAQVGNLVSGSTISLYGIGGAGDGYAAPKATGGVISYMPGYIIHTFTSSGTFTPTSSISNAEILVTGGGGSGGATDGGGGGAGGVLYFSGQTLAATAHTVTIGAGGSGGAVYSDGTSGANSSFGALTAALGGGRGGVGSGTLTGASLGSGGGGAGSTGGAAGSASTSTQTGTGATAFYGNGGGAGNTNTSSRNAGGGGGASGAGVTAISGTSGNGGSAISTYSAWISAALVGVSGSFAGGGGGGGQTGTAGNGGGGGAGNGQIGTTGKVGFAGLASSGSGGGGSGNDSAGSNGGSGFVTVRYPA